MSAKLPRMRLSQLCAAVLVLASAHRARAWDADIPEQVVTRMRSTPIAPFPFIGTKFGSTTPERDPFFFSNDYVEDGYAQISNNDTYRYGFKFIHEAMGGPAGSAGHTMSPGFMFCKDEPTDSHLEKYRCEPWRGVTKDDRGAALPWVTPRKAGVDNDPRHAGKEHNEHALLAAYAAQLAGLPPTLADTFFVRYPAPNRLIVSQVRGGFIVGPSALPLDQEGESSGTLRSYRLYEMAQLPDWSFSVADWASSNETCPLDRIEGGFPDSNGDPGNLRCHTYMNAIGPLNATHFLPASSNVYFHYHQLALNRMAECTSLAAGLAGYYSELDGRELVWSTADTEAHECEREALIYEMFGQHFLQDSWATGHMWHRWGYAEPSKFPFALDDRHDRQWDDPALIPEENVNGRRAFLAAVVAGFVGMVHGTKAVTEKLSPTAANLGLLDDPLNAPYFDNYPFLPKRVGWQDSNLFNAKGAGDLWANLIVGAHAEELHPWYQRFMRCSAMSMRQVYKAGPKAHGPLISFLAEGDPDDFTTFATECFSQRANNESMLGSVLPVGLAYARPAGIIPVGPTIFAIANHVVIKQVTEAPYLPNEEDRKKFVSSVRKRMRLDQQAVVFDYLSNRDNGIFGNRDGTESAQGRAIEPTSADNRIMFLGVPPNENLTDSPPVPFMDRATPAIPEEDSPDSWFLRRMFWRAHPEDTCGVPGLVAQLRDACVSGASLPGGDPEACTRCVALAEQQMPGCWLTSAGTSPSKCQALGHESNGGIDPTYLTTQCASIHDLSDDPAYYLAFHYCTDTRPVQFRENYFEGTASLAAAEPIRVECGPGYFGLDQYYTPWSVRREAISIFENLNSSLTTIPEAPPTSFLSRLVNAVENTRTQTLKDGAVRCGEGTNAGDAWWSGTSEEFTLDALKEALIAPLPLWDNKSKGLHALTPFANRPDAVSDLTFEQCGVTQRVSYHNRECETALAAIGRSDLSQRIDQGYDPQTMTQVTLARGPTESRCSIQEEPKLRPVCVRGTCNANGLCSSQDPPEVIRFY